MKGPIRQLPTCAGARETDSPDDTSKAEAKFLGALEQHFEAAGKTRGDGPVNSRFAAWATEVRAVWMRSHGGKAVDA